MARMRPAGRARGLNENYARELLELHTLGVDGGYTQQDVIEVARALTGWTMNPRQGAGLRLPPGDPRRGREGRARPPARRGPRHRGRRGGAGHRGAPSRDGAVHRAQARGPIRERRSAAGARRARRRDVPRTDGDIREVVRTIVTSPEFFSRAAYRAKVKTPVRGRRVARCARSVRGPTRPRARRSSSRSSAQPIFGHQAPNGWPETGDAWMNAGAILNRINFGLALAGGRVPGASVAQWPEAARLRTASREQQVDAASSRVPRRTRVAGHARDPDQRGEPARREARRAGRARADADGRVERRRPDDADAGDRCEARLGARQAPLGRPVQLEGLAQVVGLAIGAPEFQRR